MFRVGDGRFNRPTAHSLPGQLSVCNSHHDLSPTAVTAAITPATALSGQPEALQSQGRLQGRPKAAMWLAYGPHTFSIRSLVQDVRRRRVPVCGQPENSATPINRPWLLIVCRPL